MESGNDTDWYSGFKLKFPYMLQIKRNKVDLMNSVLFWRDSLLNAC